MFNLFKKKEVPKVEPDNGIQSINYENGKYKIHNSITASYIRIEDGNSVNRMDFPVESIDPLIVALKNAREHVIKQQAVRERISINEKLIELHKLKELSPPKTIAIQYEDFEPSYVNGYCVDIYNHIYIQLKSMFLMNDTICQWVIDCLTELKPIQISNCEINKQLRIKQLELELGEYKNI